ncbi:MAG: HAD family hydrolase [Theionarchaea archaeon]|nr:HAD family hydrolase [Theionarchaea archaeon]
MNWWMKKATEWIIITDLDGTIVDSEAANSKALQQVLEEFGYVDHYMTVLKVIAEGKEFKDVMKIMNITPEIRSNMEAKMKSLLVQAHVIPLLGAVEGLRILRDSGFVLCIATDNYRCIADHIICTCGLDDVFEPTAILASDTYPVRKPSPYIVEELMSRSGRKKAIILGNTPKEVAMAKSFGCPAVIIMEKNRIGSGKAAKKNAFEYELKAFGSISGKDIFHVRDWEEAKNMIFEIIQKKSAEGFQ